MKNVVSRKAIRRLRLRKGDAIIVSDFGMVKSAQDVGRATLRHFLGDDMIMI